MIALTLLVLAVDAEPPRFNEPPPCSADADCVISTFRGCCGGCCPVRPYATALEQLRGQQNLCSVSSCAGPQCRGVKCEKQPAAAELRAVCRASQCVAVATTEPPPDRFACESDAQCRVDWVPHDQTSCSASPCGCCPSTEAVAAHVDAPQPRDPTPPRPLTKKEPGAKPPFGLTQGGSGGAPRPPPQAPNCSPCPSRPAARAVCVAHRCALEQPRALGE